jgi:hypothetical protein
LELLAEEDISNFSSLFGTLTILQKYQLIAELGTKNVVDLLNWISQFSSYQPDSVLDPLGLEIICLSGAIFGSKNNFGFGSGFDLHPIFLDPTPFMQIITDESRKCRSPIFKVFNHTYATVLVRLPQLIVEV